MRFILSVILAFLLLLVLVDNSDAEIFSKFFYKDSDFKPIVITENKTRMLDAGIDVPVVIVEPSPTPSATPKPTKKPKVFTNGQPFKYDKEVSFYGPGFYGKRTACGLAYTKTIMGVAHRSLPCGTLVDFRYNGITIRVPVIDRGPYVAGRIWDLSGALCTALDHCFTGPIEYRIIGK